MQRLKVGERAAEGPSSLGIIERLFQRALRAPKRAGANIQPAAIERRHRDFEPFAFRAEAMAFLRDRGIGTQVHYLPVHRQPYYRRLYGTLELPGADAYYERALSIPLYPDMTDADADRVIAALTDLVS